MNEDADTNAQAVRHRVPGDAPGPDTVVQVSVGGRQIALANTRGRLWAVDDACTHMRSRLSDGYIEDGRIVCPAHFGKFDLKTGSAVARPCKVAIRTYPVHQTPDGIWIEFR